MNEIALLKMFVEVVEQGSLTRVAKDRKVSTALISKQLTNLEEILGVVILKRGRSGVFTTLAGQRLLAKTKKILKDFDELKQLAASDVTKPFGDFHITSTLEYGDRVVTAAAARFLHDYPEVRVHLRYIDLTPDFEREKIDLSLGLIKTPLGDQIENTELEKIEYLCVASPKYIKKYGKPKNVDELSDHSVILHSGWPRSYTAEHLNIPTLKIRKGISASSMRAMVALARAGHGLAFTHDYLALDAVKKGTLVSILPRKIRNPVSLYAAYRGGRMMNANVRAFLPYLSPTK